MQPSSRSRIFRGEPEAMLNTLLSPVVVAAVALVVVALEVIALMFLVSHLAAVPQRNLLWN